TLDPLFEGIKGEVILFHTAGIIHPKKSKDFFKINLDGSTNVLKKSIEKKLDKAIFISSNSPFGCNPFKEHRFTEESPYRPYMNYGKSKMKMELSIQSLAKDANLSVTIIRCPWFYGPNQPYRQTTFFQMIKNGKMPIVGSGHNLRSMSYIDNLCQGILLASLKKHQNIKSYWIADERPYSMIEIIETISSLLSKEFAYDVKKNKIHLPWITGEIATFVDWMTQKTGLYFQKVHVLSEMNKNIACSVNLAKRELNYQPRIQLEEGMRRSIAWCKEAGYVI
ncbi:MAG: NAD(P)-dependent oxidoreductase, partial [Halobacteriovoraceae bacterium]|nr:NAD(P)-dependent oxidoreductase [Halobacteriovoraceae bacterium]